MSEVTWRAARGFWNLGRGCWLQGGLLRRGAPWLDSWFFLLGCRIQVLCTPRSPSLGSCPRLNKTHLPRGYPGPCGRPIANG